MNEVKLIGLTGGLPVNHGQRIEFSICVSNDYKDQNGNWIKVPMWVNVVAWNEKMKLIQSIDKGSLLMIQGKLRSYKSPETNQTYYSIELHQLYKIQK